jgi:hypothetical protein
MEGIKLLQGTPRPPSCGLVSDPILPEIYASDTDYRRECSYYIALGYYKLGNYGHARRFNGMPCSIVLYH